jgi:restriction endonuclease
VTNVSLVTYTGLQTPGIDDFANTYLDEHSKPKNFLRLELNNTADFLTIKPGDLVRIKNIEFQIEDAIINKINYSSTKMTIDCEKTLDFGQEVVNNQ